MFGQDRYKLDGDLMPRPKDESKPEYLEASQTIHTALRKLGCAGCARKLLISELVEIIVSNGGDRVEALSYLSQTIQMLVDYVTEIYSPDEEAPDEVLPLLEKPKVETAH
jgi:hypothetical protein